jgi:hypothetical protein
MKYTVLFFSFLGLFYSLSAQPLITNIPAAAGDGNTYAIVIGISKYSDPDIKPLFFRTVMLLFFQIF